MPHKSFLRLSVLLAVLAVAVPGWCASGQILYSFSGTQGLPITPLVQDASGNLYGTTSNGGRYQGGTVYELSPTGSGAWNYTLLYEFDNDGISAFPGGRLILDSAGNLFGTTQGGGLYGRGQVYELSPSGNGSWILKSLYNFSNATSGAYPSRGVTFDSKGNLFGVTTESDFGASAVFELSPDGSGGWTEKTVHRFTASGDGKSPSSEVYVDSSGNLFGTTAIGGVNNQGTFYQLQPQSNGSWKGSILYNFTGSGLDGAKPLGPLVADSSGNFYGTTTDGGSHAEGTVYKLSFTGTKWKHQTIHAFGSSTNDGSMPNSGVVLGPNGVLFGTTLLGGVFNSGVVFQLTPPAPPTLASCCTTLTLPSTVWVRSESPWTTTATCMA